MHLFQFYLLLLIALHNITNNAYVSSGFVPTKNHPLVRSFEQYLETCSNDSIACEELTYNITTLCVRMANEHAQLLLHDTAKQIFMDAFYILPPDSTVGNLISRILSVHSFAQGDIVQAQEHWKYSDMSKLINQRTLAAQMILSSNDGESKIMSTSSSKAKPLKKKFNSDQNDENKQKSKSAADLFLVTTRNTGSQPSDAKHQQDGSKGMDLLFNYTNNLFERFLNVMFCEDEELNNEVGPEPDKMNGNSLLRNDLKANPGDVNKNVKSAKSCVFHSFESYIGIGNDSDMDSYANLSMDDEYGYVFPSYKKAASMLHREAYTEEIQDRILGFLFQEAEGLNMRINSKFDDVLFSVTDIRPQSLMHDSRFRFYLGVGLAKLGMFELSLGHMITSATPWEAALYRFRAQLVFSPIYPSIFALAQAVDNFERQAELLIMKPVVKTEIMRTICNSPNEAALAFQALPLLSLTGYSSPRDGIALGHSPVAIPVLLSEVYMRMCPPDPNNIVSIRQPYFDPSPLRVENETTMGDVYPTVQHSVQIRSEPTPNSQLHSVQSKIVVGVVGGSFDSYPGRIVAGLVENMLYASNRFREKFHLIAMCFPTPRDATTDRMLGGGNGRKMFDEHVNLSPSNSSLNIERILDAKVNVLIYADAGYDARVFTLAHERLALFQMFLWGWGCNTLGIPMIDFYLVPDVLFDGVRCKMQKQKSRDLELDADSSSTLAYDQEHPQAIFYEQIVLLRGVPPIMRLRDSLPTSNYYRNKNRMQLLSHLESRYLLPTTSPLAASAANRHGKSNSQSSATLMDDEYMENPHYYIFPGSVKHVHPEFDPVLKILLNTDPNAVVLIATVRIARDNLPVTHFTVNHDLMHPTMPIAAVTKLKRRLRNVAGISGDAIK